MGFIDPATVDPNILYISLLLGLWVGVTAAYVPGTGIAEFIAFVALVGSFIVLTMVATNWLAVTALVIGVAAFLVLPFLGKKYRNYAEVGLIFQAIGGFFLFKDMQVSPILIAVTLLLAVAYNRLILLPIIKSQSDAEDYDQDIVGKRGRVVKDLDPVGTVYVGRELWRARSAESLSADTPIVVTGQNGLELTVEKAKRQDEKQSIQRLQSTETQGKNGATTSK